MLMSYKSERVEIRLPLYIVKPQNLKIFLMKQRLQKKPRKNGHMLLKIIHAHL